MAYTLGKNGIPIHSSASGESKQRAHGYWSLVNRGFIQKPDLGPKFRETAKTKPARINLIRRVLSDMRARGAILETTDERIKT